MTQKSKNSVRQRYRQQVWNELQTVAQPDSRFAWDFGEFIADYQGSDRGASNLRSLAEELDVKSWFITPDNNLDALRESLLKEDTSFVMPTYGIRRGFLKIENTSIPSGAEVFASTLDGVNRYGEEIPITRLAEEYDRLDILVTGASFVTTGGLRMGKGHGYFDLEWAMLREVGLVDESTSVVAAAHDVQVIDENDVPQETLVAEHDTIVDYIVTPSRIKTVENTTPKPEGIYWNLLDESEIESIPPLRELRDQRDE